MRMNAALIVLSLMTLVLGILCVSFMHGNLDALSSDALAAVQALPGDIPGAQQALERFAERWDKLQERWQLFAIHEDLDDISATLTEARDTLEAGDTEAARVACDQLLLCLQTIHSKEIPSFGNIF